MHYQIINNKLYRINDDGTSTYLPDFDPKKNLITEFRKYAENKKDVEIKKIKTKVKIANTEPISVEKRKRGRPKKNMDE